MQLHVTQSAEQVPLVAPVAPVLASSPLELGQVSIDRQGHSFFEHLSNSFAHRGGHIFSPTRTIAIAHLLDDLISLRQTRKLCPLGHGGYLLLVSQPLEYPSSFL